MRKALIFFLIFFAIDIVYFWGLWDTFFQQDEWYGFSNAIVALHTNIFSPLFAVDLHYVPMVYIMRLLTYEVFGLHAAYYAWLALILHSIVATLVYFFFKKLTKNKTASFLMTFLFLVSFPAKQSVVWMGETVIGQLPVALCVLLFFIALEAGKSSMNYKRSALLCLLFFLGLFFKEDAVILIPLVPVYLFLFWKKQDIKQTKKYLIPVALFITTFFVIDAGVHFFSITQNPQLHLEKTTSVKQMVAYNVVTVPFKMIVQNIIEYDQLQYLSFSYSHFAFPNLALQNAVVLTIVFENIIFFLAIFILSTVAVAFGSSNTQKKKLFVFALLWILVCSVPLSLQTRRIVELESRYLFLANIGVLLLGYCVISSIRFGGRLNSNFLKTIIGLVLFCIFAAYFYWGDRYTMESSYLAPSLLRKSIVSQLTAFYPTIPKDTTFYISCKSKSDCYPLTLPFQSSVGEILTVIYSRGKEAGYTPLLSDSYLFDWKAQGYKKVNGYGFGYFTDENLLVQYVSKKRINVGSIISLQYDKEHNTLIDVTLQTRHEIIKTSAK